ncbi:alpha/beta hydrolase [Enorma sp.]|uniref:serine aminopeptidase domain-containing protein n=1 Tax=Enorma sp. TaxID=1920692 RepID=UPI0025C0A8BD|nr:alpha/beta hydrolase [Enorma sp.]
MKRSELRYPSADGASCIRALVWEPDAVAAGAPPRAVVQLVHGMAEHVERYERFAGVLCAAGYAVCAEDHVGHGKTAATAEDLGHIPLAHGVDVLLEDMHALRCRVCSRYEERAARAVDASARQDAGQDISQSVSQNPPSPLVGEVPYVLFGHSLGSFMVRVYLARWGEGVSAAVVCGTGQQPRWLVRAGNALCHVLACVHGERYRSALVDSLAVGAYGRAIKHARTPQDWLSYDDAVVDAYRADPCCGFMFTVGGYAAATALASASQDVALASGIPRDVPLLFIAGADDPVGDCGAGVHRAVAQYRKLGMAQVDEIIYDGMRHEILNEPDHERVERDVLAWLEAHV